MKQILYSNYNLDDYFDETKQILIDCYPELCTNGVIDSNGSAVVEPADTAVWDMIHANDDIAWDDFSHELDDFLDDKTLICFGSIGRWSGACTGGKIGTFSELYNEAIKDCDYVEFADDNGHLYLKCSHHDGTNYFEFKVLTEKGINFAENWNYSYAKPYNFSEEEMHGRIVRCSFLSRLPRIYEKLYK